MPAPHQSDATFNEVNQLIWKHLDERDWTHPAPRALAISIALEASELLEHYQWENEPVGDKPALAAELADILIYAFQFAQCNDIDMVDAIKRKLAKSAEKYPAEAFKGKADAERRLAWVKAKQNYKKTGL